MYDITVLAPELKGLSIVKQHRMINEVCTSKACILVKFAWS